MNIIYLCLLITSISLQGAASMQTMPPSGGSVTIIRDSDMSALQTKQTFHCLSELPGLKKKEALCFHTHKEKIAFIGDYMQTGKRIWYGLQEQIINLCGLAFVQDDLLCPKLEEPLSDFIQRVEKKITHEMTVPEQDGRIQGVKRKDFAGVPWHMLRYIIAVNLRAETLKPDAILPKLKVRLLDLAVQNKDMEVLFFVIDCGARKMGNPDSVGILVQHMLRSSDKRSVQVLKEMSDDGVISALPTYEWATHLLPELVKQKMHAITGAHLNERGIFKSIFCIPIREALKLPDDTPGAEMLKIEALKLSDLQNCERSCIIS